MDFTESIPDDGLNITDTSAEAFRVPYEAPRCLVRYQQSMHRLGHDGNITRVLEDMSTPVIEEYFMGLIVLGVILLGFFVSWSLILLVFKFSKNCSCCGGRKGSPRVGFLSGLPFVRTYDEDDNNPNIHNKSTSDRSSIKSDKEDHNDEYKEEELLSVDEPGHYLDRMVYGAGDALGSRPTILRFVFLLSGLICIVFGCLMATQGITNLETSFATLDARANDLLYLVDTANEVLMDGLLALTERATVIRNVLTQELADVEFCPQYPGFFANTEFTRQIMNIKTEVLQVLELLDDFKEDDLKNIEEAISMIFNATADIAQQTESYSVTGWESLIVLIPYTIFPSLLMMGAILALFDVSWNLYDCFLHWFILPIFIIMTVVAYVFAAIMTLLAGVNSDFCLPAASQPLSATSSSPDEIFYSALEIFGYPPESWEYQVAQFYISQCKAVDPFASIRHYETILEDSFSKLGDLNAISLNSDAMAELSAFCNRDYDAFNPLVDAMNDVIEILALTVAQALDLAQCGRIIPLYTDTVYEAGCKFTPKAIFWILNCCLILGFFGMVMITLRSAMRPSVHVPSKDYLEQLTKSEASHRQRTQSRDLFQDDGDLKNDDFLLEEPDPIRHDSRQCDMTEEQPMGNDSPPPTALHGDLTSVTKEKEQVP